MSLRDRIIAFAEEALAEHVQEHPKGSNRGPDVDYFNMEAGAPPGSAWCLSFAYHCISHAAEHEGVPVPIERTASCAELYRWAVDHGRTTREPQPGDIGLLRGGPHGHHHAVIVRAVLQGGLIQSIEGNTDTDGSPEGYEVARRIRHEAGIDFVRVA